MIRVEPGFYRDVFCRVVFDVYRVNPSVWTYRLPSYPGIKATDCYLTKREAETAARMAIYSARQVTNEPLQCDTAPAEPNV